MLHILPFILISFLLRTFVNASSSLSERDELPDLRKTYLWIDHAKDDEAKFKAGQLFDHIPELEEAIRHKLVLDVGAGFGYKAKSMLNRDAKVFCVEENSIYCNYMLAREFCDKNLLYKCAVQDLPSPLWKTFDVVTCCYVPYNLFVGTTYPYYILSAIYRMLKEGGLFIATFSHNSSIDRSHEREAREYLNLFFPGYKREYRPCHSASDDIVIFAVARPLDIDLVTHKAREIAIIEREIAAANELLQPFYWRNQSNLPFTNKRP